MNRFGIAMVGTMMAGASLAQTTPAPAVGPMKLPPVLVYGTVDTAGAIHELGCGPKVGEKVCKPMMGAVAAWQFQPGTRAGQPTAMAVSLNLSVIAVPQEKGYSLQVTAAKVMAKEGETSASNIGKPEFYPPIYPPDDFKHGRTGVVDVEIILQPPAEKLQIGRLWFNGAESDRRNSLVRAATDSVMRWKLPALPPEQLTHCVSVEFSTDTSPPVPADRKSACEPRFAEGFALPVLVTKVGASR